MLPFEDRFSRQRCLPQVGESGQRRLSRARCVVHVDAAGRIEAEYLARSGISVEPASAPPATGRDDPRLDFFEHVAARDVASGAWNALRRIRQELDLTP